MPVVLNAPLLGWYALGRLPGPWAWLLVLPGALLAFLWIRLHVWPLSDGVPVGSRMKALGGATPILWIPIIGWLTGVAVARTVRREYLAAVDRVEWERTLPEDDRCATRYPILLVHGVGWRDRARFNAWGRIPKYLKRHGAAVFHGEQEAWGTIEANAAQVATRIRQVLEETGAEKVNLGEENDGLVSVDSAKWGEFRGVFRSSSRRGVSHGDLVDMNREDFHGFNVLDEYITIVAELKERGF